MQLPGQELYRYLVLCSAEWRTAPTPAGRRPPISPEAMGRPWQAIPEPGASGRHSDNRPARRPGI